MRVRDKYRLFRTDCFTHTHTHTHTHKAPAATQALATREQALGLRIRLEDLGFRMYGTNRMYRI